MIWPIQIISTKYGYIHDIHKIRIISTERGDSWNADNIHKLQKISTMRTKYCTLSHKFITHLHSLHGNQNRWISTALPRWVLLTMSTPNSRVVGMISRSIGSSEVRHSDRTSVSTYGMVSRAIINRSSRRGYLTDNAISSHRYSVNSASKARKLKTLYVGKYWYPISIIKLTGVL